VIFFVGVGVGVAVGDTVGVAVGVTVGTIVPGFVTFGPVCENPLSRGTDCEFPETFSSNAPAIPAMEIIAPITKRGVIILTRWFLPFIGDLLCPI
jgi:hypothetical protein